MNNNDIARYSKRIARMFWDPPPKNEHSSPIWCLGKCYTADKSRLDTKNQPLKPNKTADVDSEISKAPSPGSNVDRDGTEGSFVEVISARDESPSDSQDVDDGWPGLFLDDFQSKIWLTYRSNFEPIPQSHDPSAASAISWTVRLRNQLNQEGFTSDTGWGCMIRSGQNILANALVLARLGRGQWLRHFYLFCSVVKLHARLEEREQLNTRA